MRVSSSLALLALAGCATDASDPVLFGSGSPDEIGLAEDLAYEDLFTDGSPAMAKGIGELRTLRVRVDDLGMAHTHVQQLLDGVPVWGGEAIVHISPEGMVTGYTDDLVDGVDRDVTPDYSSDEAIDIAIGALADGWTNLTANPKADLWVLPQEDGDHLAWRVTLHHVNGRSDDSIPVVFVDANDGAVVWQYNNLQTATCTGDTNFYGTVSVECYNDGTTYYLENTTELVGTYTYNNTTTSLYYVDDVDGYFAAGDYVVTNAVEGHYVANKANDYFSTAHGRNGIDGAGGPAAITSHGYNFLTSATSYYSNYVNASWDPTNLMMSYGDGDGVNSDSLTTLDVGGHELTHGVTQYEANLTYSGESGGLNESMSDVFGAMVERSVLGESADTWLLGEDTWTPGTAGDALRYMNDPADDGVSYDYYFSGMGTRDVHYTSGVGNLAFYLLSQGGSHPRGTSTTVVTAIGADAAADIWYLALSNYMTSSTSYSGARTATLNAAAALYGASSTEYTEVGNAWTAVGVAAAGSCTTSNYSSSLSRAGRTNYHPGSSGTAVSVASQTVTMTGPATANFQLYLDKKSGRTWSTVASSTGATSTESISYSGTSGTYRTRVYSQSGSGSYSVSWCK